MKLTQYWIALVSFIGMALICIVLQDRAIGSQLGTGFVINKNGYILTANHVITGKRIHTILIYDEDSGKYLKATIIKRDANTDLALLKVQKVYQVTVLFKYELPKRETSVVLGFPAPPAMGWYVHKAYGDSVLEHYYLNTYIYTCEGNSGSPVLNGAGEVRGMVQFGYIPWLKGTVCSKTGGGVNNEIILSFLPIELVSFSPSQYHAIGGVYEKYKDAIVLVVAE